MTDGMTRSDVRKREECRHTTHYMDADGICRCRSCQRHRAQTESTSRGVNLGVVQIKVSAE